MQASSIRRVLFTRNSLTKGIYACVIASFVFLIYYRSLDAWQIQEEYEFLKIKDIGEIHFLQNYNGHCLSISEVILPRDNDLYQLPLETLSCLYQRHVTSLQSLCTNPKRYGNVKYGGFRICVEDDIVPIAGCTIYSYNHPLSKRFTDQMYSNFKCKTMLFGEKTASDRRKYYDNLIKALLQKTQNISVLILRLYSNDTAYLREIGVASAKSRIKQIIMEMHLNEGTRSEQKNSIVNYLSMLRHFNDSGYQIYWNDRNWEFVQKGDPKCYTANLYFANSDRPMVSNKMDLPNIKPFGAMPMSKGDKHKYESIYWGYISHHQILCKTMVRMGNILDGGWDICHDIQFRPRSPCIVYSFGINYDFSFDNDVIKTYGCDVYAFDPSMKTEEFIRSHLRFYKIGIGEADKEITFNGQKWKLNTLKTILEKLNHTNKRIDLLKMDIEDNELQTLPEMIRSGAMKNVAQFYLEFHHYYDLGTLRQLHDLGFRIFWSHQNPQAEVYEKNRSNSYGNDVYFVNINFPK